MTKQEKLLLMIAYQNSGVICRGGKVCPSCMMIGDHAGDCVLGKMEDWVRDELMAMWKEETQQ